MPVLDAVETREDTTLPTETQPRLQELPRRLRVGGSSQDRSIIVIENPFVDGHIGYLLAMDFFEAQTKRGFKQASHARIYLNNYEFKALGEYQRVTIQQGFDPVARTKYDFLLTGSGNVLPRPSIRPYEIAFIEPELFDKYLGGLRSRRNIEQVLGEINSTLAQRIKSFELDQQTRTLVLPENYASLTIPTQ